MARIVLEFILGGIFTLAALFDVARLATIPHGNAYFAGAITGTVIMTLLAASLLWDAIRLLRRLKASAI